MSSSWTACFSEVHLSAILNHKSLSSRGLHMGRQKKITSRYPALRRSSKLHVSQRVVESNSSIDGDLHLYPDKEDNERLGMAQ